MDKPSYKIEGFEGPLEILLQLISKHKMNINDIPIVELVDQYIDFVRQLDDDHMEIASEFLEMAARLVYIKTVSLLPVHDEADELKKELTAEIIEYRDCLLMADELSLNAKGFDLFVRNPAELLNEPMPYKRLHEPSELLTHYLAAVGKGFRKLPPPVESFKKLVAREIVSISDKITGIINTLREKNCKNILELYKTSKSRSELVAIFLAILELSKSKKVRITEKNTLELLPEEILVD